MFDARDARGNLVQVRYPDETVTRTAYDVLGRPVWTVDRYKPGSPDAGAHGTQTIYDELGSVTESRRYNAMLIVVELDADPNLPTGHSIQRSRFVSQGTLLSTTVTTYDSARRVGSVRGPDGRTTAYEYENNGRVSKVTNPLGQVTQYQYFDKYIDPGTGLEVNKRFDEVIDAAGRKVTTEYDYAGRVKKTIWHGDSLIDTDDIFTDATYADHGLTVTTTDQERDLTDSEYDLSGRLTAVVQADPDGAGMPQVRPRWVYGYDKYGNQTLLRDPRDNDTFGGTENRETLFGYDAIGLRTKRTLPETQFETWTYDQFGRVDLRIDFEDQKAKHIYYASGIHTGRLQEVRYYAGASEPAVPEKVEYQYDELGRTKQVTERAAGTSAITRTVTHAYDGDGRLTEKLTYGPGKVPGVDAPDEQLRYAYHDATGRLVRTYTGPSGAPVTEVQYGYDELGRLKSVTVEKLNGAVPPARPSSIRYDAVGNSMGTTTLPNTVYTYDEVGNLNTVAGPNGVVHDYDYDPFHRLDVLTVKKTANGPSLVKYDYQVFADGQRDYVDETSYDANGNPTGPAVRTDWDYDNLNRLITERYAAPGQAGFYNTTYTYNEVGNRLTKVTDKDGTAGDETITYATYDRNDRLITETSTLSGTTTYGYDKNGSMTSRAKGAQSDSYGFDLRNRLTSATVAGVASTFGYDHAGNRVSKTVSGGATTHFLVDANNPTGYSQVVQESATLGGTPSASFVYGLDLVYQNRGGADAHYAYDGSGNARLLTSTSGTITDTYRYDAFGVAQSSTGATTNDYRYAGERLETATGNIHLRARDYDAGTGRFTSADRYEGEGADPSTLHKYLYANANPVYYADPSGFISITSLGVTAANALKLVGSRAVVAYSVYDKADTTVTAIRLISQFAATGTVDPLAAGALLAQFLPFGKLLSKASFIGNRLTGATKILDSVYGRIRGLPETKISQILGEAGAGLVTKKLDMIPTDFPVRYHGIDGVFKKGNRLVIVESKGGASELAETVRDGYQMSGDWITSKIDRLLNSGDPLKMEWGRELQKHMNAGTLDGMVVRTPRPGGVVGDPVYQIKNVQGLGARDGGWTV